MLADLVHGHDVRMLQPGDRLRFEPISCMVAGEDHLEGDFAIGSDLKSAIDDPHAAAADLGEDPIAGHLRKRQGCRAGKNGRVLGLRRVVVVVGNGAWSNHV